MRKNKTCKKKRTSYTYYSADGTTVIIKPGENGVTEALIAMLHEADDNEFNSDRRQQYHAPVHYQAYIDSEGNVAEDRNDFLADDSFDPEKSFIDWFTQTERSAAFKKIWDRLLPQQRDLIKKKLQGHSNLDIAAKEGVTETAIRNRLKKIQDRFEPLR